MFALVDCNNFYASCERIFRPDLRNKPIVVLSNNDGCIIARSNEAKKLGITMGQPYHEAKEIISKYGVSVFSTNFTLYGDISNRVMSLVSQYAENSEIYSIDEIFLDFKGLIYVDLREYGLEIIDMIKRSTGIPLSIGIAPTKTLAKLANRFAKKYHRYNNCCVIDNEEKRVKALELTKVKDIWGIGRRLAKKLNGIGITNAYQFSMLNRDWVKKHMTVVGEKTWRELRGEPCIEMEIEPPAKKNILTSRSFGANYLDYTAISESVSSFAAMCARKLRKQNLCASSVMVFIHTNNFNPNEKQYSKNCVIQLPEPTNSSIEIIHYANEALKKIYRKDYNFKKAGVMMMDIVPANGIQLNLFYNADRDKHNRIMNVMDYLNHKYYRNTVYLGSQGQGNSWKMKQEKLSPKYTTRWDDILKVKIG